MTGIGAFIVLPSIVQTPLRGIRIYFCLPGDVVIRLIGFIPHRLLGRLISNSNADQPLMTHLRLKTNNLLFDLSEGPSLDTLLFLLHHSLANRQSTCYSSLNLPPLEVDDHPNLGFQYLCLHYFEQ